MSDFHFQINIGTIKVGTIGNASALNVGRNYLRNFKAISKTNQGLGNIHGDHLSLPTSTNYVEDPDMIDVLLDPDVKRMLEAGS